MRRKLKSDTDIITPDSIFIKEWNLDLFWRDIDSLCIAMEGDMAYVKQAGNHFQLRGRNRIYDKPFDLRAWQSEKVVSFWADGTGNYLKKVKMAMELIENEQLIKDFSSYHLIFEKIDILGNGHIVDCPLVEIDEAIRDSYWEEISINCYDRGKHLLPPRYKGTFMERRETHMNYINSCRYWKRKIGEMDVAEYHLLEYEE